MAKNCCHWGNHQANFFEKKEDEEPLFYNSETAIEAKNKALFIDKMSNKHLKEDKFWDIGIPLSIFREIV